MADGMDPVSSPVVDDSAAEAARLRAQQRQAAIDAAALEAAAAKAAQADKLPEFVPISLRDAVTPGIFLDAKASSDNRLLVTSANADDRNLWLKSGAADPSSKAESSQNELAKSAFKTGASRGIGDPVAYNFFGFLKRDEPNDKKASAIDPANVMKATDIVRTAFTSNLFDTTTNFTTKAANALTTLKESVTGQSPADQQKAFQEGLATLKYLQSNPMKMNESIPAEELAKIDIGTAGKTGSALLANLSRNADNQDAFDVTAEALLNANKEIDKAGLSTETLQTITKAMSSLDSQGLQNVIKAAAGDKLNPEQVESVAKFTAKLMSSLPQDPKMRDKVIDGAGKLLQKVSQGSFNIKEDLPNVVNLTQEAFLHLKPEERRALMEDTIKTALTLASDKLPAVDGDKEAQKEFIAKIGAEALSHIPSGNLPALAEQVEKLIDMASKEGGLDLSKLENQDKLMGLAGAAYGNLDPDQKAKLATSMLTSLVDNKDLFDKAFPEYSKLMPRESMIKALDTLKDAQAMINGKDGKLDAKDLQALTASFFKFHDADSATAQASSKIMNEIMTKARTKGAEIANLAWSNPHEAARQGHITNAEANQIASGQAQAASAKSFIPMLFTFGISGRIADRKLAEGMGRVYGTAAAKAEQAIGNSKANLQNDGDFGLIARGFYETEALKAASSTNVNEEKGLRDTFKNVDLTTGKKYEDAIKYLSDLGKKKVALTQDDFDKATEHRLALSTAQLSKSVEANLAHNTTKNGTDLRDSEGNPIRSALEGLKKLHDFSLATDPRAFDRQELQTKVTAAKAEVQDYLDGVANVFKTGRISVDKLADLTLDDPRSIPSQLRNLKADGTLYTSFEKKTAEDVNTASGTRFSKGQDSQYNFYVLSGRDKDGKDTTSVVATTKDGKHSWVRGTDDKGEAKWSASLEPGMAEAVHRADKGYASLDSYSSKSSEARNYVDSVGDSATGKVLQDLQAKGFLSIGQLTASEQNKFAGYTVDGKQYLGYEVGNRKVYMKEDGSSVFMDAAHEKAYNKAFEGLSADIALTKEAAAARYIAAIDELKAGTNGFDRLPEYLKQQELAQNQTQQPVYQQPSYQQPVQQYRPQQYRHSQTQSRQPHAASNKFLGKSGN